MDIESDDSERWEDFFGSATELESILGIYDNLTANASKTSLEKSNSSHITMDQPIFIGPELNINSNYDLPPSLTQKSISGINKSANKTYQCNTKTSDVAEINSSTTANIQDQDKSILSTKNSSKHRSNIRVLSPNVQRLITISDIKPVDAVDINAVHNNLQNLTLSPVLQHRFVKKPSTPTNTHKAKFSHIPLSKTTGKLTQSGNDLVDTFDSSTEYLDALSFSTPNHRSIDITTPSLIDCHDNIDIKTTTSLSPSNATYKSNTKPKLSLFNTDSERTVSLIELEKLKQSNHKFGASKIQSIERNTYSGKSVATNPQEIAEAINYSILNNSIKHMTLTEKLSFGVPTKTEGVVETINIPLISKSLARSSSAVTSSKVSESSVRYYSRSNSLSVKANKESDIKPIISNKNVINVLEDKSVKSPVESIDLVTINKPKFSPKEVRKHPGLIIPDIAKLKIRPLSSSSICSTTSSSSSGSDQLNSKLNSSYLASVESLADHSENESTDLHISLSVYERACMEIIDSERSYVEDLGQVIKGYLLDWKERACLSYDELKILFSNIQDVYKFNTTLLKKLMESGINSLKIANCFIELRGGFDVYTKYCTSYPEAISLLTKLLQATHTNALLASTQKMLQHTLPLGSYLLKPVQRILKYHLLLDNLRKHSDVKEVTQAHEIMRQVAYNIDQVKRKLEQQSRVKELAGILDGWLGPELTVLGELRQEGLLMENNKPRLVFLFSTMLILTKQKEDSRLQFKSYIHQNNLMLSEHLPGDPTSFYVIPYDEPRHQIKLTAKNREQKRLWTQHIKAVILEKFDNIPNHVKELVYKLGDEEVL
ncbi:rhoGEF domain-containing protein gxcJ-like [Teleopsis dalmanni]|uniref:rhoGEF domain-containing protein gxcJ-like n=1 Tax=Teleopsis dalmanni TaxID=139649 RepID=UPI0018CF8DF8|nr:rhoGEF domain-containing protein gxcJ-like [Teleopsis dalmanni]